MIRRIVEYFIDCDNKDKCVEGFGNSTAFGSRSMEECAESAKSYGWQRVSKRRWICPQCVTREVERSMTTTEREG